MKKAITLAAALDANKRLESLPKIENTKRVTTTLKAVQILKGKQKEGARYARSKEKKSDITASRSRLLAVVR